MKDADKVLEGRNQMGRDSLLSPAEKLASTKHGWVTTEGPPK